MRREGAIVKPLAFIIRIMGSHGEVLNKGAMGAMGAMVELARTSAF